MEEQQGFVEKFISIHPGEWMTLHHDGTDRVGFSMNVASSTLEAKALAARAARSVRLMTDQAS